MTYYSMMSEIYDICVNRDDVDGMWYLEPQWKKLVQDHVFSDEHIDAYMKEYNFSWDDLREILHLQVDKKNAISNKTYALLNKLYDVMDETTDPALVQEQNEYLKNIMDYMRLSKSLEEREKVIEGKQSVSKIVPKGMNFKKGI